MLLHQNVNLASHALHFLQLADLQSKAQAWKLEVLDLEDSREVALAKLFDGLEVFNFDFVFVCLEVQYGISDSGLFFFLGTADFVTFPI